MTRSTEEGRYSFVTDCIGADGYDIREMRGEGKAISVDTFRKAIGQERWKDIQAQLGYGRSLPIRKDWHVGYYRGTYRGVPAVYLVWSGIEYVFTLDGKGYARGSTRRAAPRPSSAGCAMALNLDYGIQRRQGYSPAAAAKLAVQHLKEDGCKIPKGAAKKLAAGKKVAPKARKGKRTPARPEYIYLLDAKRSSRMGARGRAGLSAGRNERQRELERAIDYHAKRGEQGQVRALSRALAAEQQGIDTTDWALPMGAYYRAVLAERQRMDAPSRTLPTGRAILPPSIAASPAFAAASPASAAAPMESAPVTVVEPSNERNARRAAYLAEHLKDLPENKYYPQLYDRYLKAQREVDPGASSLGIVEFTRRIRDLEAMYEQKYARKWRFDIEPGRGRIELIGVPL
jgi:hypothetical protein